MKPLREWLNTIVMVGVLLFGIGQWAGVTGIGTTNIGKQLEQSQQQIGELRVAIEELRRGQEAQLTRIYLLEYRIQQNEEQVKAIARTVGAPVTNR